MHKHTHASSAVVGFIEECILSMMHPRMTESDYGNIGTKYASSWKVVARNWQTVLSWLQPSFCCTLGKGDVALAAQPLTLPRCIFIMRTYIATYSFAKNDVGEFTLRIFAS